MIDASPQAGMPPTIHTDSTGSCTVSPCWFPCFVIYPPARTGMPIDRVSTEAEISEAKRQTAQGCCCVVKAYGSSQFIDSCNRPGA